MRSSPDLHHFTRDDFAERVQAALTDHDMIPPGAHVAAAVSGGADSVVLLHLLHRFRPQLGYTLSAVHINHHLRDEESDRDENWVRNLSGDLGIEVAVVHEPISADSSNLEEKARDARRRVYRHFLAEGTA